MLCSVSALIRYQYSPHDIHRTRKLELAIYGLVCWRMWRALLVFFLPRTTIGRTNAHLRSKYIRLWIIMMQYASAFGAHCKTQPPSRISPQKRRPETRHRRSSAASIKTARLAPPRLSRQPPIHVQLLLVANVPLADFTRRRSGIAVLCQSQIK